MLHRMLAGDSEADDGDRERAPGGLDDAQSGMPHTHESQSFDPTDRPFHNPANLSESTDMLGTSFGNVRFDSDFACGEAGA